MSIEPDEDYQDAFIQSNGRLDITRHNYLDGALNFGRAHQGRDDPENDPNQTDITEIYQYGGSLGYTHLFNRVNVTVSGRVARDDYAPNDDSDRDQNSLHWGTAYRLLHLAAAQYLLYGDYTVEKRDQRVDSGGVERDTKSWEAGVGASYQLTDLITSDVQVGYTRQTYAEGSFNDNEGVGYALDLTWTPTQLTTVRATGSGDWEPTSSEGSDAQSNFRSGAGVSVDHELLRNVHLGAHVNYVRDDFSGPSRTDNGVARGRRRHLLPESKFLCGRGLHLPTALVGCPRRRVQPQSGHGRSDRTALGLPRGPDRRRPFTKCWGRGG